MNLKVVHYIVAALFFLSLLFPSLMTLYPDAKWIVTASLVVTSLLRSRQYWGEGKEPPTDDGPTTPPSTDSPGPQSGGGTVSPVGELPVGDSPGEGS